MDSKQAGVLISRLVVNSGRSCPFAGAEESDIIASTWPFSVRPAGVNIQLLNNGLAIASCPR